MSQFDKVVIRFRRVAIYSLAAFVVTSAVALSVARLLLPEVQGYKEKIEQKIAVLIEQNIKISSIDARLIGFTPTIVLKGVHLIDDSGVKEILSFKEAHLGIAVVQSLKQHTLVPSNFTVVGTTISILQREDGGYLLQGFDLSDLDLSGRADSKISEELANWLMEQASVSIKESTVVWKNINDKDWYRFEGVNLVLHNRDRRHQLTGSFKLPDSVGDYSRVAMDVEGNLLEPKQWRGQVYLSSKQFRISRLGIQPEVRGLKIMDGIADYELWGNWQDGGFKQVSGDIAIHNAEIENTRSNNKSRIDKLKGKFDWQGSPSDWQLRIKHLAFETQGSVWKESTVAASWTKTAADSSQFGLRLSYAKIDDIRELILKSGLYTGEGAEMLAGLAPVGEVRDLDIYYTQADKQKDSYRLLASLTGLGITPWEKIPGLYGLNAKLNITDNNGQIEINGKNVILNMPRMFRHTHVITQLDGKIGVHNTGNGWVMDSRDFKAANSDLKLDVGFMLLVPENVKAHYLDMQIAIRDMDITSVYKFQPTKVMKEKLVAWIDNSFKSGQVPEINVAFRGWSNRFPFRDKSGVLSGNFLARNVDMDYFPQWPGIEKVDADGFFTEKGILVTSNKATLHNGSIKNLSVRIDDFLRPIMYVEGDAYSTTHDGFHFFAKTPIGQRAERFVSQTRFEGDIHTHMTFSLALDKDLAKQYKKRHSGYVETSNAQLYMMRERMDVTDIKGRVYFSDQKHHGEGITAKVLQGDTKISVTSKIVGVKPVMEIMGEGSFDAVMLDRRFEKLGLMRVTGQVPWKGRMILGHQKADSEDREPAKMWLESDLVGVGIDLPEPFRKSPETVRHSVMKSIFLPEIKTILNVQYGDRMSTEMRLNNNYFPARIEIGEMKLSAGKAKLPEKDEFRLSGVVNNMDQYGWRDVMQEHYNKYKKLRTRPIVEVPVIVDFAYVNVPFDKDKAKPRKRYTSPTVMPAFKGQVRRFVFAGKEIGKVEFDSRRDNLGLAFDKLRVTSPHMEYNGKLTWHYIKNWHETRAKGELKTSNLGEVLKNFGFAGKFENGKGEITLDLNWRNPFYVVQMGYIDGSVKIGLEDGIVTAFDPGAGKFLGLLNISNLPRRLLGDFDDIGSGFAFDKLTGNITVKDGVATSKDLAVDSTIADVLATGRVELRKKELDTVVTVTPQVAGTMPIVSGLLIGTGVIPVVWLFERIFGTDIDKSISRQYHVKGLWQEPKVERIDK